MVSLSFLIFVYHKFRNVPVSGSTTHVTYPPRLFSFTPPSDVTPLPTPVFLEKSTRRLIVKVWNVP